MLWTDYCRRNALTEYKKQLLLTLRRNIMWSKPEYTEMRFGFEVTMYIANR